MKIDPIKAAGGVVTCVTVEGIREVLVVHRPHQDDWTLPKGKLERGESWEQAALREVCEETGIVGRITRDLATTHYLDASQRPKEVRYFEMEMVSTEPFVPNDEVDEVRWCRLPMVDAILTYDSDRSVLDEWKVGR